MKKRLVAIAALMGIFGAVNVYAVSPENAKIMAQKYKALANSYDELAAHYEAIAQAGSNIDVLETSGRQSNKEVQATKSVNIEVAPASVPLNPWGEQAQSSDKAAASMLQEESGNPKTNKVITVSSLNLPEGIANDDAISQKKPNIAVASPWKGTSFGLGGSIVTGNSAATNYSSNANITYNPIIPWQNTLVMSYLYNRDDMPDGKGVKTNKFLATATTSWNFDKNNGVYARVNYINDQLDTYTYMLSESIGYQRQLYSNNTMTLSGTVGPSLTQQKIKDTGETSNAPGAQGGLDYVWNFTDNSSFKQSILANWTANDSTTYQSNSTLSTEIYKNLILQLGFQVNGSSWASSGKKRVNTITSTTIAYSF